MYALNSVQLVVDCLQRPLGRPINEQGLQSAYADAEAPFFANSDPDNCYHGFPSPALGIIALSCALGLETKCTPFCKHFRKAFGEDICILIDISLNLVPKDPIVSKSALVQEMAWSLNGLSPFMFTDTHMRHHTSVYKSGGWLCQGHA